MAKSSAPKSKEETQKRRQEVLDFMKTIGPFSIPARALAEKHDCTEQTIYNDRDYLIKKISFKNMGLIGKKVLMHVEKNMSISEEMRAKGNVSDRLRAVQTGNQTADTFTKLLESYGFKQKVADKLDVKQDGKYELEVFISNERQNESTNDNSLPKD